ncbi:MAG: MarR family transcriptional regulator [Bacillota bacterium]|nr:MarR family transcriptional regulator [Bacillota bacterium]
MRDDPDFGGYVAEIENVLRMVSIIIRKRGRDILENFNVTPPQLNALNFLRHGILTMGELGQKMYLACSTATDLIDRMERNGLIQRERDTSDRRVIRLKMTVKGNEVIDEVLNARKRYLAGVLAKVASEDRKALVDNLHKIYELMKAEEV